MVKELKKKKSNFNMKPRYNTFETQCGKRGRDFRLICIQKGKQERWINKVLKYDWYYVFKYFDDNSFFSMHEDFNDNLIEKLNHEQTLKILWD
jgi:hypothetical protein